MYDVIKDLFDHLLEVTKSAWELTVWVFDHWWAWAAVVGFLLALLWWPYR
jgi:hypothetical protein